MVSYFHFDGIKTIIIQLRPSSLVLTMIIGSVYREGEKTKDKLTYYGIIKVVGTRNRVTGNAHHMLYFSYIYMVREMLKKHFFPSV